VPIKTCWWSFLKQVTNVPVLFLWSRLWRKHCQFCFAVTCPADASSPLVQPPSIRQSRCRWHRSIQLFKCFNNGLGHKQGHHSHTTLDPPKKTSSLTRYFAATCRLWILECLQNYDIGLLTEDDNDSRQAQKPSCWTHQRFDVRADAVDAVPEALHRPIRRSRWLIGDAAAVATIK